MTPVPVPAGRAVLDVSGPGWDALSALNRLDSPWAHAIRAVLTQRSAQFRGQVGVVDHAWILLATAPPLEDPLTPCVGVAIFPAGATINVTEEVAEEWTAAGRTGRPLPAAPIRLDDLQEFCEFLGERTIPVPTTPEPAVNPAPADPAVSAYLEHLQGYATDVAASGERRENIVGFVRDFDRTNRPDGVPPTDEEALASIVDGAMRTAEEPLLFSRVRATSGESLPDDVLHEALGVLTHGNPFEAVTEGHHLLHEGDNPVAACLALATAVSACTSASGLHLFISGDKGTGKSHSVESWLRQIPKNFKLAGSFSDKSLLYGNLQPGTVVYIDDRGLSDDLQATIKNATSHFQEKTTHMTLSRDRTPVTMAMPERCVFLFSKIDDPGDDQVLDRCLCPFIDNTVDHLRAISQKILLAAAQGYDEEAADARQIQVCRAIWAIVKSHTIRVNIPFAPRIQFRDDILRTPRNQNDLLDLIRGFAVLNFMQRGPITTDHGLTIVDATEDDFRSAQRVFRAIVNDGAGDQVHKLTPRESRTIDLIKSNRWFDFELNQIQASLGVSHDTARQIVHGARRNGEARGGLLQKCPAISWEKISIATDEGKRTSKNVYHVDQQILAEWNGRSEPVRLAPDNEGDRRDLPTRRPEAVSPPQDLDHLQEGPNDVGRGDVPSAIGPINGARGASQPPHACASGRDRSGVSDTMLPGTVDPGEFHRMSSDGVVCHRCGHVCSQRGGAFQRDDGFVLCGDCLAPLQRASARDLGIT